MKKNRITAGLTLALVAIPGVSTLSPGEAEAANAEFSQRSTGRITSDAEPPVVNCLDRNAGSNVHDCRCEPSVCPATRSFTKYDTDIDAVPAPTFAGNAVVRPNASYV